MPRAISRSRAADFLINNWEATYFRLNEKKIEDLAREGKKLGIELFCCSRRRLVRPSQQCQKFTWRLGR
ncbi:alpha-galactosidase [Terrilactibacillus sp. S3-3]|nr:alpha-galactosidase [Terrilactibacillus sp. S3-3]